MNYARIGLSAAGGFLAYFLCGGLIFGLLPLMRDEFRRYPAVYRNEEGIRSTMPLGMAFMFLSILVLAVLYAMQLRADPAAGPSAIQGARFGALIGIFAVGAFVLHNYVNLNIGWKLTLQQAIAYFFEWTVVGIAFGLIYRAPPR